MTTDKKNLNPRVRKKYPKKKALGVALTEPEYKKLKKIAKQQKISVSKLLRQLIDVEILCRKVKVND